VLVAGVVGHIEEEQVRPKWWLCGDRRVDDVLDHHVRAQEVDAVEGDAVIANVDLDGWFDRDVQLAGLATRHSREA
jgi:hypothetical protein